MKNIANKITIPSWFWNSKRPTTEIIDSTTNESLGKITNPNASFFSWKGYVVEVRDSNENLCFGLSNNSCCVPFFCCPFPCTKFNLAEFDIKFPEDALMEGENLEMSESLNMTKKYSNCLGEWWSATALFEFNTISTWTNFDYARILGALHMMVMMYFHE